MYVGEHVMLLRIRMQSLEWLRDRGVRQEEVGVGDEGRGAWTTTSRHQAGIKLLFKTSIMLHSLRLCIVRLNFTETFYTPSIPYTTTELP